jgi:hypothetical protein
MRKKSQGFAVVAVLVGVAVFATLMIVSYGGGGKHAQATDPGTVERTVAASDAGPAGFTLAPQPQPTSQDATSVAQHPAN